VLKDLERSTTVEARTVLGAAVIDDVLGLVVLSVVVSAIAAAQAGGSITVLDGAFKLGEAAVFLVGAIVIGLTIVPRIFSASSRLASPGVLFALSLAFCFSLAWGAGAIGLAPIVGAYAAGLILEEVHFRDFPGNGQQELEVLIHPLVAFLAPVFFVMIGMRTDLSAFADGTVVLLAGVLLVVGIVGKIAAGLGAIGRGIDRLSIGIGMIPRGEVGLIFANMGLAMGEAVLSRPLFSALVIVVLLTTVVTPPLLSWSLTRPRASSHDRRSSDRS
jgi:Kef-type K+ transport system membrane component KefB